MSPFAGWWGAFSSRSYVTSAANAGIAMAARLIDANAASLPVVNMHILPWVSFHILANSGNFWSRSCGRSGRENPSPARPPVRGLNWPAPMMGPEPMIVDGPRLRQHGNAGKFPVVWPPSASPQLRHPGGIFVHEALQELARRLIGDIAVGVDQAWGEM